MRSPYRATWIVLLLAGCSSPTYDPPILWEATLSPIPPAIVRGTAGAVAQGGRTRATISIRQGDEGQAYEWGVYAGTCQDRGALQGGRAVYSTLTPSSTGSASQDVALSTVLDPDREYAVWLTQGPAEATPMACGELEPV